MSPGFSRRNVGSIVVYSLVSGLALSWLFLDVIGPMVTTLSKPFDLGSLAWDFSLFFQLLITVMILFAVAHNGLDLVSKASRGIVIHREGPKIKRFTLNQRIQHVLLFVATAILAVTGFAQMYYEAWGRILINAMGGLAISMDVHLLAALILGVLIAYHFGFYTFGYLAARARGEHPRLPIMIGIPDIKDAMQNMKFLALGRGTEPNYGKYDYAQKFDYWGIYWGMVILGAPGVLLWAYGYGFLGGLPFIFHTGEALLAVLFLLVFHFYQAHWNPRDFPMNNVFLSGEITEGEMRDQHPLELEMTKREGADL
jgi:cytochrome b subunit of formate dehydrogenase